jgi:hypothetical protein
VCLLDALRAGAAVEVARAGEKWAVTADGKAIAKRKYQHAADELLEAAREEVALSLAAAIAAPAPAPSQRRTVIITPQKPEGETASYELVEASALVPSHRPTDFRPDSLYPPIQERSYHSDQAEQLKVTQGAQLLRPELLLARTPSPLDGPPIVTEPPARIVLGGNGRSMMILLAYARFHDSAAAYRKALAERAPEFGLSRQQVEAMSAPVLVRVVDGLSANSPREQLAAAVRRYNEGLTQRMDPVTRAVAQARALSASSVTSLGAMLAHSDLSLREVMRSEPAAIVQVLMRDGVITNTNRSEWVGPGGSLTDLAKDTLEGMFLGVVMGTADRVMATPPGLLQKVERAVPHLVAVGTTATAEYNLIPSFVRAVDALNDARTRGVTFEAFAMQGGLFGDESQLDPSTLAIGQLLNDLGPRQVGDAFKRWASYVNEDPGQARLFGDERSPRGALSVLNGRQANPRTAPRVQCARCGGSGRVSPWAGRIDWCPVCQGTGRVQAPEEGPREQLRLINPAKRKAKKGRGKKSPAESMVSTASTTGGLAGELVRRYGGVGFPPAVAITTAGKKRLVLHFKGKELAWLSYDRKRDDELLEALRADLLKRHPLV